MRICLVGCAHGKLDYIYQQIARQKVKPDLVLIAGDFQAVRSPTDLESMAVPKKYRQMGDFKAYFTRQKKAPFLTVVIGGNHESSKYMEEKPQGGWLADNIYYMGRVGVIDFKGITIGGISGVYAPEHYTLGHFEKFPYDQKTIRSVYHIRKEDIDQIIQMGPNKVDIMLSHDWPRGIEHFGDLQHLLKCKSFLKNEIEAGTFGSAPARDVLDVVQPRFWLSAHMHIRYDAIYPHDSHKTQFIGLDKALPKRNFLQFIDIKPRKESIIRRGIRTNKFWKKILTPLQDSD